MTRKSIRSFIVAGFAAASMMTISAPVYAGTAEQSPAQAEQGWCEIVPAFCRSKGCGESARCNPCGPGSQGTAVRNERRDCVANRE
jgi:hypothetical protein